MDELIYLIIQVIAEAFGAKKKRAAASARPGGSGPSSSVTDPGTRTQATAETSSSPRSLEWTQQPQSQRARAAQPSRPPGERPGQQAPPREWRPSQTNELAAPQRRDTPGADSRAREADRRRAEPSRAISEDPLLVPTQEPTFILFRSSDDFIRAVILREVLGPPLSRRSR